jgi:tRNA uridine 5-carboxymethylaminomethyl modification enzyme
MMKFNIPVDIDYRSIGTLTNETCEKLDKIKPKTLREASEVPGVSTAHISALAIYIKGRKNVSHETVL